MAILPAKTPRKKKAAAQPPAPRGLFTPDEVDRLLVWLPKYMQLKRLHGKRFTRFWEPLWEEWFAAHPLKPLTREEILAGVDQGERRGERARMVQQVSLFIYLYHWPTNELTRLYFRKFASGLITIVARPEAQANVSCLI